MVIRPDSRDRETVSDSAVAVDRVLRADRPECYHVQGTVGQGDVRGTLEEIREQNPVGWILLVADNYSSHQAKLTQRRADDLGIEFLFIPPFSPMLHAIEPLWKDLKREISPTIFEGKEHFRDFVTETFLRLSRRYSFAVDWIETFLPGRIHKLRDHSCDHRLLGDIVNEIQLDFGGVSMRRREC